MSRLSPRSASPGTARRPATASGSADTDLWVRVEEDRQAPGDEPIWGYAKTIRPRSTQGAPGPSELDVVVAGALVVDPVIGIVKADIGIKDGRIVGVGRAGNAAISDGIDLPIGPHTEPIMGYGLIATPGAVDSHVHLITPELLPAALSGGVTTLLTAGFEEPPWAMAADASTRSPAGRSTSACRRAPGPRTTRSSRRLLDAGACGFKIHEDYGAYPELIDHALRFADAHDVASRSTPTACTSRPSSRTRSRRSPGGPSTPTTSRGAAAGTCPTCSGWSASPTSSARRRRRRSRGASTPPPSRSR